jgi:hypothetical protein
MENSNLDFKRKPETHSSLQKSLPASIKLYIPMPPMVHQVALVLGRLLITYVTLYYKDYKDRSMIQKD